MFVKFALVVIVFGFVALDQLTQCASLKSDKNNDQVNVNDVAEVKDLENMLLREIVENAALRYKLRLLSQTNDELEDEIINAEDQTSNDDEDSNEFVEEKKRVVAKRFPKWRSGDTRSRVRLLHQQQHLQPHVPSSAQSASSSSSSSSSLSSSSSPSSSSDYNTQLRNRWENNMFEKNKLYQSMLG